MINYGTTMRNINLQIKKNISPSSNPIYDQLGSQVQDHIIIHLLDHLTPQLMRTSVQYAQLWNDHEA
jgi:hypothetical protein